MLIKLQFFSTDIPEKKYTQFWLKMVPFVAELFHAGERTARHTDMTKPLVGVFFFQFGNAPKNA